MKPYAEMVSFNITPRLYLSLHLYKLYILSLFMKVHQVPPTPINCSKEYLFSAINAC